MFHLLLGELHMGHWLDAVVASDGQQALIGVREAAQLHDLLRRFLQVPGAAVIAKALPQLHEPLLIGCRQSVHRGEHLQKPGIISQHRRHSGLLKHDLRHPDAVGILRMPPREIPRVFPVPDQQWRSQRRRNIYSCRI